MYCSLSGAIPECPVVSAKTGHLYERRLIEKAIETNGGKCPHTDVEMSASDLIEIRKAPTPVKSAPPASTDVLSMLKHVGNEWDATKIELHALRQALVKTREELATALYRLDASHRVIAKLREGKQNATTPLISDEAAVRVEGDAAPVEGAVDGVKDAKDAKDAKSAKGSKGSTTAKEEETVDASGDESEMSSYASKWPPSLLGKVQELGLQLVTARKSRKLDKDWTPSDEVSTFGMTNQRSLFSEKTCVTSIVVGSGGDEAYAGAANGRLQLFDTRTLEAIGDGCDAHTDSDGGLACLWWDEGLGKRIVSGGGDGWVRVWDCETWRQMHAFNEKSAIVGFERHAERSICLVGREDGWTWRDIERGQMVARGGGGADVRYGSSAIHPDGLMFATGCADGVVQMWDVGNMECVHRLGEKAGVVKGLAMSEKGYYLGCCRGSVVELWDLRKRAIVGRVDVSGVGARDVRFDGMGEFGCAVGDEAVCLFAGKKKAKPLARIPNGESADGGTRAAHRLGVAWGRKAECVFVGNQDGKVGKICGGRVMTSASNGL